jgi:hypothetical protein
MYPKVSTHFPWYATHLAPGHFCHPGLLQRQSLLQHLAIEAEKGGTPNSWMVYFMENPMQK